MASRFLPPQADQAEVCAWLSGLSPEMSRYFPSVFHGNVDGHFMYSEDVQQVLNTLGVVAILHQEIILQVYCFC